MWSKTTLLAACAIVAFSGPCSAQPKTYLEEREPQRLALIIGNENYEHLGHLPSARLDADAAEAGLIAVGFKVTKVPDLRSVRQFEDEVLPAFRKQIQAGDFVVFLFSGHGFTYGAHNFIAPTELPLRLEVRDIGESAIAVENIEEYLAKRAPGAVLLLLDSCRTVAGFIIPGLADENLVAKSISEPVSMGSGVSTLVGYAARPGYVAIGSSAKGELSLFSKSLTERLKTPGVEFSSVFKEVSADVRQASGERQRPGLFNWSETDLYFARTETIASQEREAWLSALSAGSRSAVERFSYRHAVSAHATAARQWLKDHPVNADLPKFTRVSPAAVERAWKPTGARQAILPSQAGLAFDRVLSPRMPNHAAVLANRNLGLVPSGSAPKVSQRTALEQAEALNAHGTIVVTKDFLVRTAPKQNARVASFDRVGTRLAVRGITQDSAGNPWLEASIPGNSEIFYLEVRESGGVQPVELGQSLLEITAPKNTSGLEDLVAVASVQNALGELRKSGRTITWVSLAVEPAADHLENQKRLGRLTHASYLLRRSGVDERRITAVATANDIGSGNVRLRFFGF